MDLGSSLHPRHTRVCLGWNGQRRLWPFTMRFDHTATLTYTHGALCYVHSTLPIVMLSQLQLELAPTKAAFTVAVCARVSAQLDGPLDFSRLPSELPLHLM